MDASPLGRLPAELRNRIYELVLTLPTTIEIDPTIPNDKRSKASSLLRSRPNVFALVKTCRQVHSESNLMIYANNTFDFSNVARPAKSLRRFVNFAYLIGSTKKAALSSIQFRVDGASLFVSQENDPFTMVADIKRMSTTMSDCTFHVSFARVTEKSEESAWKYVSFKDQKILEASRERVEHKLEAWKQRLLTSTNPYVPAIVVLDVEIYMSFLKRACAEEEPDKRRGDSASSDDED